MQRLHELPDGILDAVAAHLDQNAIRSLARTNRRFKSLLWPRLHKCIEIECDGKFWHIPTSLLTLVRQRPGFAALIQEVVITRCARRVCREPLQDRPLDRDSVKFKPRWKSRIYDGSKTVFGTGTLSLLKRLPNLTSLKIDIHFARSRRLVWREHFGFKPNLPQIMELYLHDEDQHLLSAREFASCCKYGLRCIEGWAWAAASLRELHITGAFEDTLQPVKFHQGRLLPVESLWLETSQLSFESLQNMLFHFGGLQDYHYNYVERAPGIPAPKHAISLYPHSATLQTLELLIPCTEYFGVYGHFKGNLRQFPALKSLRTAWATLVPMAPGKGGNSAANMETQLEYQLPPRLEQLILTCCRRDWDERLYRLIRVRDHLLPALREVEVMHHRLTETLSGDRHHTDSTDCTDWSDLRARYSMAGATLQISPCTSQLLEEEAEARERLQNGEGEWTMLARRVDLDDGRSSGLSQGYDRTSSMQVRDGYSVTSNGSSVRNLKPQQDRSRGQVRVSDASSIIQKPGRSAAGPPAMIRAGELHRRPSSASHSSEMPSLSVISNRSPDRSEPEQGGRRGRPRFSGVSSIMRKLKPKRTAASSDAMRDRERHSRSSGVPRGSKVSFVSIPSSGSPDRNSKPHQGRWHRRLHLSNVSSLFRSRKRSRSAASPARQPRLPRARFPTDPPSSFEALAWGRVAGRDWHSRATSSYHDREMSREARRPTELSRSLPIKRKEIVSEAPSVGSTLNPQAPSGRFGFGY